MNKSSSLKTCKMNPSRRCLKNRKLNSNNRKTILNLTRIQIYYLKLTPNLNYRLRNPYCCLRLWDYFHYSWIIRAEFMISFKTFSLLLPKKGYGIECHIKLY